MSREERLRATIKELRDRLNLTQTALADLIGKSYPMLRKYEQEKAPMGEALAPFALVAIQHGQEDLAEIFRAALIEDLGKEVIDVLRWERSSEQRATHQVKVPAALDAELVEKFIEYMLEDDGLEQDQVLRALLPHILMAYSTERRKTAKKRIS